ncbi:MAG: AMP-binding protein [Betaproteobacteria bacterium]|nr:AMP-binding protein [Betaproteobacteria bacterium]
MNAFEHLLGAAALARHGERIALICGDQSITYTALAEAARRASAALFAEGVRPGDRVLLLMRDSAEMAAAWLGTVRLGAVAVALNTKLSEAEYRHILHDSAAKLAIIEDVFALARPDLTRELAEERRLLVSGSDGLGIPRWQDALARAGDVPPFAAQPDSPAFLLYSSGTTGRPKGMVHRHASIQLAGAAFPLLGIGVGDTVFTTSKVFFAYGLEHGLLAPLGCGASTILSAEWPTAKTVTETVERHAPQALFSVPTIYRRLLAEEPWHLGSFRSVRRFVSAGEHLSRQLVDQWRASTGAELLNLYGMSETFCAALLTPPGTSDGSRTGRPLEGVQLRVEASPAEEANDAQGVLWIKHPAQVEGYLNLPERTAEQFREGWFCTRDVFGRDPEGHYVYRGRADDFVKIAGQWVQPAELEEAVAGLPEVAEAACVALPDSDGLDRLALFVSARGDAASALSAACAACEKALPRHKRPKWMRVVEQLPRTATGKVQRFKLRELLQSELSGKR